MEILGGPLFAVAGAGESHGPGVVSIVFGCPPGFELDRESIQHYLDRRRPGSSKHGTARHEDDRVVLLSGLYSTDLETLSSGPEVQVRQVQRRSATATYEQGRTTGEPIAALVLSTSQRSRDYRRFVGPEGIVRPGHTDLVKHYQSLGYVDVRGGGRSSYRSTISDVVGGSIARLYLEQQFGTAILSSIVQVGPLQARKTLRTELSQRGRRLSPDDVARLEKVLEEGPLPTLDTDFGQEAAALIRQTRIEGDSLGAGIEVVAVNVPPLLGSPLYHSLKLRLMGVLGGLHAVQSCEVGDGAMVVARRGSENNDPIRRQGYQANSHGGLIGGVTTGSPIICRVGFKPTSTISKPQLSVQKDLREIDLQLKGGRHDPCVGVRAGVTLESRLAIELLNALLVQQAGRVDPAQFQLFDSAE